MLIANAEVWQQGRADVRIEGERIAEIGALSAREGERVLDARGGALLPGLHDHHIHLAGLAVRSASVWCGPPEVTGEEQLTRALAQPGEGWLRGIGYHESVLGILPDAAALDRLCPHRPLRLQHRSGRMWLFNTRGLELILGTAPQPPGLERENGSFTGRLFDEDRWLREALGSSPPDFAAISRELAAMGVTGITDVTPGNDTAMAAHFAAQQTSDALIQHCLVAGTLGSWTTGPFKLHLHEAALPHFDTTCDEIARAHELARGVAVHCVSEVELVFALALFEAAGTVPGDRIEHASVAAPDLVARIAALGLAVCVQPHFIAERGDRYLADVEARHLPDLYRIRTLAEAGIALAGGSDAPFASADPWAAMRAAVSRRTAAGAVIGAQEALEPDAALSLWLADPTDLSQQRRIAPGERADLCLLGLPWAQARERLDSADVAATIVAGELVHNCVDQPPGERLPG